MAEPVAVQKLKHGKALCGATFGAFVETFNWIVDFCLNLKGDQNAANASGAITVDRSDPSAPVIRFGNKPYNGDPGGDPDEPETPGGDEPPETPDEDEPGSDPDEPYEDPEDFISDDNSISDDDGTLGDDSMDYCNTIGGFLDGGGGGGNAISSTCS